MNPEKDMNEQEVLEMFNDVGAIVTDRHVVYTSGKHGATYINKNAIYPHTGKTSRLCRAIAERFKNDDVEAVIAPTTGGVILSHWTAHHLTAIRGREVLGVYAEKERAGKASFDTAEKQERFVIERGYDTLIAGKNVLVVDDALTTGNSVKEVVGAVRTIGGLVIGLGTLFNRGGVTPQDVAEVPKLNALAEVTFDAWDEEDCPLCKKGIPIDTTVGKGREFAGQNELRTRD